MNDSQEEQRNSLVEENQGLRDRARAESAEGNKNPFGLPKVLLEEINGLRDKATAEQGIKASFSDKQPSTPSTPNNADKGQKPEIGL